MSIHAQLHPDAKRRLHAQQRTARATSIIVAILATTLLALLLTIFAMRLPEMSSARFTIERATDTPEDLPRPTINTTLMKRPTAPSGASNHLLVVPNTSDLSIPVPDLVPPTETSAFGTGSDGDLGEGDDFDSPGGSDFHIHCGIPRQRCSKPERLARLSDAGVGPEVDEAVLRTLRWLKTNQQATGSWGQQHQAGMTGLALLAYLGHCETPLSVEFGDSVTNAIVYLLDLGLRQNGKLATNLNDKHWPYEHAIATYALAEALTFAPLHGYSIPNHEEVVRQAGQWIINNQHESGGWDYSYTESGGRGGDLSIVGWQLQALKACQVTGIDFRNLDRCVREALAYVEKRQDSSGGFGYTGTQPVGNIGVHSLTGVGVLSFQIWDKAAHSAARKGVRYIAERCPFNYTSEHSDLYAHYYSSQAMMRHGGERWENYNRAFATQLLAAQNDDGSFRKPGGGGPVKAVGATFARDTPEGIHYRNCLAALMLEVYYRYLPATGG